MSGSWSWRLIMFSFFLFFVVSATYAGIEFGYTNFLTAKEIEMQGQIAKVSSSISDSDRQSLAEFYSRLTNLTSVLAAHTKVSVLFPLFEKATDPQVAYDSFSFEMKTKTATIVGHAASFDAISRQLLAYQNAPGITKVLLQNSSVSGAVVNFSMQLTLDSSVFKS